MALAWMAGWPESRTPMLALIFEQLLKAASDHELVAWSFPRSQGDLFTLSKLFWMTVHVQRPLGFRAGLEAGNGVRNVTCSFRFVENACRCDSELPAIPRPRPYVG